MDYYSEERAALFKASCQDAISTLARVGPKWVEILYETYPQLSPAIIANLIIAQMHEFLRDEYRKASVQ